LVAKVKSKKLKVESGDHPGQPLNPARRFADFWESEEYLQSAETFGVWSTEGITRDGTAVRVRRFHLTQNWHCVRFFLAPDPNPTPSGHKLDRMNSGFAEEFGVPRYLEYPGHPVPEYEGGEDEFVLRTLGVEK